MAPECNPLSKKASGLLGALLFLALAAVSAAHGQNAAPKDLLIQEAEAALPETPAAVRDLVEIHPFRLQTGYRHNWLASRPLVTSGLLVVLKVDPRYVLPRDTAEPILYAGDRTVERLNHGQRSGYVIGIVPGEVTWATALAFFGNPGLPGRVTPEILAAERAGAERAGIKPFSAEQIERASRAAVEAEDLPALLREQAADLVLKYSPDERSLAETWRLPTTGAPR